MNLLKIFILSFLSIAISGQNDYEYDYSDKSDNYFSNSSDDNFNEKINFNEVCSVDLLIDKVSENILPEDYEEVSNFSTDSKPKHLNQTIAIIKRLHQYSQNVSKKIEPIIKRIMPRMSEILLSIDLPSDCMASLTRIGQSAQDGQIWAMKCRFF